MQFESVRRWLNGLRNEVTRKNYVFVFYGYCQETQMAPNQLLAEKEASLGNPNMRGAAEDRLTLWYHRKEASAPGTAVLTFKSVRSFFKANYLPLSATIPS